MAPLLPTLAANARSIFARADSKNDETGKDLGPPSGVIDPHHINNKGMFALFALIGVAFVLVGIWFFFWAKNGGFYFREDDWDDYKSTVLRRKGPNGTILSNATKSTKLGGGSIYKDLDDTSTEYTGAQTHTFISGRTDDTGSTLSGVTAGASDLAAREKRAAKRERREREREKKRDRKHRHGRKVGEDGALVDEEAEAEAKDAMRAYRHEKAARVGGINKESEGSQWDGSTNPSNSAAGSTLLSDRQPTPTTTPERKKTTKDKDRARGAGGIRKVYSTADRREARENDRIKAEARRLQDKGRAAGRRDFSYQRADSYQRPPPCSRAASDLGTKSYSHHIPGLSSSSGAGSALATTDIVDYAEDRRKKRGNGYRRARDEA
ncbi:cytochrome oxidase maturation [Apiospora phragmitis]|uniref:Cytochrome oxidase maturation n=1 Tax=Apiospora phragmitis TaxID=2905665 RepID=A0ABR1UII2_9PEZI